MTTKKIMIIDDDQSMLFLEKAIFASAGYEVFAESDSTKALAEIKQQKPQLILLDIAMPEINGIELAQKIRADKELNTVHVFGITGTPLINEHNKGNFEKIIMKPFHMKDLLKEINSFFDSKVKV